MWIAVIIVVAVAIIVFGVWFYHHQCLLRDRAYLMHEAIKNRDFTFHLPVKGLFFGESALQQTLNEMGQDINRLVAQNEVESWQRLTRVLTHEIMNATTPIQSISQAYLDSPKIQGTPYEEGIRAIHDTSTSLAAFVDSYRKMTQLQEPNPTDVDMYEFVASVRSLYPDLQWSIAVRPSCIITADENLLRQVFINIIKNAVEAGAKTIDIRVDKSIYISNDGQPIPVDVRREIFIPFFTTKSTGSGIGLALSRQVMMMQGMTLTLADTPVSGFHVTFVIQRL
ncbi:MAG: HAMP domain-containing histidine kinase [Bacteroidaceae bacterium]|nr:HAMP domain-containing histidine kinase [Bacteroidaceae bacterium]